MKTELNNYKYKRRLVNNEWVSFDRPLSESDINYLSKVIGKTSSPDVQEKIKYVLRYIDLSESEYEGIVFDGVWTANFDTSNLRRSMTRDYKRIVNLVMYATENKVLNN